MFVAVKRLPLRVGNVPPLAPDWFNLMVATSKAGCWAAMASQYGAVKANIITKTLMPFLDA